MSIIERYIWKNVLFSILVAWLSIVALDSFFAFLAELNDTNPNTHYGNFQAFQYTLMGIPKRLYEHFPTATLIGSLLGLGNLAAHSELTAMRAAGVTVLQIISMTLKLGFVLALMVFALGEWVAPQAEQAANSFKVQMQKRQLAVGNQGLWFKDGNRIVHIAKVWSETKLGKLEIYLVNPERGAIESMTEAETAQYEQQTWVMRKVHQQRFLPDGIQHTKLAELRDETLIPSNILTIAAVKPNQLSAQALAEFIQHQENNQLNSIRFKQAFWQHFTTPLSTLVMLIVAAPFVFNFQRNAGAGQRIFIGILVGLVFFLFNRTTNNIGIVYGVSPLFSAALPLLTFLVGGLWMLRRVR